MSAPKLYLDPQVRANLDADFAAQFGGAPERYFSALPLQIKQSLTLFDQGAIWPAADDISRESAKPIAELLPGRAMAGSAHMMASTALNGWITYAPPATRRSP